MACPLWKALTLSVLFAVPAAAGRVPTIDDDFQEKQERDWNRDPSKKHLQGLVLHLGDLITDTGGVREDNVPGVDHFLTELQDALKATPDLPRWDVLENAKEGRDMLQGGYDDLRKALDPLLEARGLLREVGEVLVPEVRGEVDDSGLIREGATPSKTAADGIEPDAPAANGPPADASAVEPIQTRAKKLEPLGKKLEEAGKKVAEAKPWQQKAKARAAGVDMIAEKAKQIEKKIGEALGRRATRGFSEDLSQEINSEKVLRNANKWLKEAVKRAEKAIEVMEKQTAPDEGLGKVNALAGKSDAKNMFGKGADKKSAARVNGEVAKVKGEHRPKWDAAQQKEEPDRSREMQEAVAAATQSKADAAEAAQKAEEAAAKAEEAAKAAEQALAKAAQELKKLDDLLGPDKEGDLADLPPLILDAPRPKQQARNNGPVGPKIKSTGLKYPKILDVKGETVIGEYGERGYGSAHTH